jgi:hypothetical protein
MRERCAERLTPKEEEAVGRKACGRKGVRQAVPDARPLLTPVLS